ncbi:crp-like helix-turn-helix domain protein [Hydrogenophaga sp. RAC07]|uniref:Crp/Fnr family transcriptional regulator n=1 Tax=Hydrogenophaga sp. RAC07 TaxID=1842537 RepID=UPI00083E6544|nr:Crp/Fnr family transcriptional regulator [Hydrogenophaga sp. RAC07]AOF86741.1 crp-like helix-turn-helix domain protein [Hydrogenophaga sp. RAC07]
MNPPNHTPACNAPTPISRGSTPGRSSLADLLRMLGNDTMNTPETALAASRMVLCLRRVPAGDPLFHMGAPSDALYFVCSGTFKIFRTDEDGYEQMLAFAGRREVLAFDALCMDFHPTAATALEDATVYVVPKADLPALSRAAPALEQELRRAGSQALTRTRELVDVMAAVASEVRLARFLLQLSNQMAASGQSPRRFHLRMGRRDIASMLGVAHETVSRSFTALAMARLIHVNDRDVEILDMAGLQAYSRSTRRAMDDLGAASARRSLHQRGGAGKSARLQALPA